MDLNINDKLYLVSAGNEGNSYSILTKSALDSDVEGKKLSDNTSVYEVQVKKKFVVHSILTLDLLSTTIRKEAENGRRI